MRPLGLVLAASLLAAPAAASAADVGGFVLVKAGATQGRDDAPLSLPGVDFDSRSLETAAVVDGHIRGLRFRLRAEAFGDPQSGWPDRSDIRLKELSYGWRLDEAWSLSIGKQQRAWGSALSAQPLGFFRSDTDLTDTLDSEGRIEGLPMVVATRLGEKVNFEAIISDPLSDSDPLKTLNNRQIAVRLSGDPAPRLNASLILRQRSGAPLGVGGSATYAAGAIELHADAFYGPPQARYVYAGFSDPTPVLHTGNPFILEKHGPASLRTVIGVTWTPTQELGFQAEWSLRGDGVTGDDWNRYLAGLDLHRAALATPRFGQGFQNLAWDLSAARAGRTDHLLAMASLTRQTSSYRILTSVSLADGSAFTSLSAGWTLPYRINLSLGLSAFSGGARTELGVIPIKGSAYVSLSRAF